MWCGVIVVGTTFRKVNGDSVLYFATRWRFQSVYKRQLIIFYDLEFFYPTDFLLSASTCASESLKVAETVLAGIPGTSYTEKNQTILIKLIEMMAGEVAVVNKVFG
ncbi:hypothetical protein CEXT_33521 [Caerostris extrusa]|uniref:Uncharacterized protein n=1 Tax=Caerostris extrusa TaxID=172846 RepID=A0AAV4PNH4_CAEEX|nr:hypothetical protein CEXT_33521 [Caerostris extrusa]